MSTSREKATTPIRERLVRDLPKNEDFRYDYDEEFLNMYISAQIRVLREQRGMTQEDLAKAAGTGQSKISAMETDYGSWSLRTLRKLARAFGVRLFVTFEGWGELIPRVEGFNRKALERPRIENDRAFDLEMGPSATNARGLKRELEIMSNVVHFPKQVFAVRKRKPPHKAQWLREGETINA